MTRSSAFLSLNLAHFFDHFVLMILPTAALADEILVPGEGQVRALIEQDRLAETLRVAKTLRPLFEGRQN